MKYNAYQYLLEKGETFADIITWLNNFALKKHNRGLCLRGADFRGADLHGADLCKANLRYADLCKVNLCKANLRYVDLSYVDLRDARLDYSSLPLQCSTRDITIDEDNLKFLLRIIISSRCDSKKFNKIKKLRLIKSFLKDN